MPQPSRVSEIFKQAVNHVKIWEGGLVDDPDDLGGITKWGIALRGIGRILGFTRSDIQRLAWDDAVEIYREHYWRQPKLNKVAEISPAIAIMAFDCAINQGQRTSVVFLQKACLALADGVIGPKTLHRISVSDPNEVLKKFFVERSLGYAKGKNKYHRGWFNRLVDIYDFAKGFVNE